jgi:hypothetical protein
VTSEPSSSDKPPCPVCSSVNELDTFLGARVTEAAVLRNAVTAHGIEQAPQQLLADLQGCRVAIDRIEGILVEVAQLRARAKAAVASFADAHESAWNDAANSPTISFAANDPAPRERYARYELAAMDQRLALRRAQKALDSIEGAAEVLNIYYRGLRDRRFDLNTAVSLITIETRMEHA